MGREASVVEGSAWGWGMEDGGDSVSALAVGVRDGEHRLWRGLRVGELT